MTDRPTRGVAIRYTACPTRDPLQVEEAKRVAHDAVIADLADNDNTSRGPVRWGLYAPSPSTYSMIRGIDKLSAGEGEPIAPNLVPDGAVLGKTPDSLIEYLEQHPDGVLVVAFVEYADA